MLKSDIIEIEVELTGLCNLHCPLCARNYSYTQHLRKYNKRKIEDIISQLDEYPNLKLLYLAGTSSEPTLYHDFFKLCKYTKDRGVKIELFTNGNTHNTKWWKDLSNILMDDDEIYFVIAGATQEVHEKYRVGSNLQEIINNANVFRSEKKNDILQFIRLEYNRDELNTEEFKAILDPFQSLFIVDSDMKRSRHNYVKEMDDDVMPFKERQGHLKQIMDMRPKTGVGTIDALCIKQKSIFLDQFGKVYGCYNHAKEEEHNPLNETDLTIDFNPIVNFDYEVCLKCEKRMIQMTNMIDLEYIY